MPGGPYFLGIGAQKSGTTWLARYLRDNPEVGMTPLKELHYWTSKYSTHQRNSVRGFSAARIRGPHLRAHIRAHPREAAKWVLGYVGLMAHSDRAYRHFLDLASHGKSITGEITPDYASLGPKAVRRIEACLNRPRYIFMLRNPADRFISQIGQEAFRVDPAILTADPVGDLLTRPSFAFNSDYRRTLETFTGIAGTERVLTLFFEDLFDPAKGQGVADQVCDYLGIARRPADIGQAVNTAKVPRAKVDRGPLVRALRPTYDYCLETFGARLPPSWTADLAAHG